MTIIAQALINAVKEQIGQDEDQDYGPLRDVYEHGADSGFPGFTYYSETCEFFSRHQRDIVDLVKNWADECGEDPIAFVAGFSCLNDDRETRDEVGRCMYGKPDENDTQVPNALAWFACEEVARHLHEMNSIF
tara:strand:+ start:276 stop:674 length:399 start_codon:yes stop_codon:yes gene_type:complete